MAEEVLIVRTMFIFDKSLKLVASFKIFSLSEIWPSRTRFGLVDYGPSFSPVTPPTHFAPHYLHVTCLLLPFPLTTLKSVFHLSWIPFLVPWPTLICIPAAETEGKAIQRLPHLGILPIYRHKTQTLLQMTRSACCQEPDIAGS